MYDAAPHSAAFGRVFVLFVGGQQEHDHRVGTLQDLARRVQTVDAGKVHVHQHQIGLQLGCHRHRVLARLCLPDHVEAVGGLDHHARGHAERRLVVDDKDTDGHRRTPVVPGNSASVASLGCVCQ